MKAKELTREISPPEVLADTTLATDGLNELNNSETGAQDTMSTHCETQAVGIYNKKGLNEIFLAESVRFGAVVIYTTGRGFCPSR